MSNRKWPSTNGQRVRIFRAGDIATIPPTALDDAMHDALPSLLELLKWRIVLCLAGSIALAFLLSTFIAPFTAGYCLALVIAAFVFGLCWQSRAAADIGLTQDVPEPPSSAPVAVLGMAFVGLVLGAVLPALLGSRVLAALALVAGIAAVAAWQRFLKRKRLRLASWSLAVASILGGFVAVLLYASGAA